jgi:ribosomal protein L5
MAVGQRRDEASTGCAEELIHGLHKEALEPASPLKDAVEKLRGMNITIVTTAKSDDESRSLLTAFGMPFRK